MRCVIQRVTRASVTVGEELVSEIGVGFLALLGVEETDDSADAAYIADKIGGLRVFEDSEGKMNRCLSDVGGSVLLVSQFTLLGDARHGRRPSFSHAARPEKAEPLCDEVRDRLRSAGLEVRTGRFRTDMQVSLNNDGPVTILLDSKRLF